tara:strand:- start:585 stop:779 length:195 start_codon:yes stop_codon:yes gene_type:complete
MTNEVIVERLDDILALVEDNSRGENTEEIISALNTLMSDLEHPNINTNEYGDDDWASPDLGGEG